MKTKLFPFALTLFAVAGILIIITMSRSAQFDEFKSTSFTTAQTLLNETKDRVAWESISLLEQYIDKESLTWIDYRYERIPTLIKSTSPYQEPIDSYAFLIKNIYELELKSWAKNKILTQRTVDVEPLGGVEIAEYIDEHTTWPQVFKFQELLRYMDEDLYQIAKSDDKNKIDELTDSFFQTKKRLEELLRNKDYKIILSNIYSSGEVDIVY